MIRAKHGFPIDLTTELLAGHIVNLLSHQCPAFSGVLIGWDVSVFLYLLEGK